MTVVSSTDLMNRTYRHQRYVYDFTRKYYLLGRDRMIAALDARDGARVLEIGCGTGNLSVRVKRAHPGVELAGSDPDPLALARAQRKARDLTGIRFERGYAQQLPYPDASFDRVLSALMLHHLDHDTKAAAAAEVFRVLRPGGSLHLADFTGQKASRENLAIFIQAAAG